MPVAELSARRYYGIQKQIIYMIIDFVETHENRLKHQENHGETDNRLVLIIDARN